jgi:hypothetical protein
VAVVVALEEEKYDEDARVSWRRRDRELGG